MKTKASCALTPDKDERKEMIETMDSLNYLISCFNISASIIFIEDNYGNFLQVDEEEIEALRRASNILERWFD